MIVPRMRSAIERLRWQPPAMLPIDANTRCSFDAFGDFRVTGADGRAYCRLPIFRETLPNGRSYDTIDVTEMKHRLLAIQALETARCFEEGVLTDVREADVGSILGFGFAPFTGGTLSYIDFMGTKKFVELCHKLEAKYGSRFTPPKLLEDMAARNETFYGRFTQRLIAALASQTRNASCWSGSRAAAASSRWARPTLFSPAVRSTAAGHGVIRRR